MPLYEYKCDGCGNVFEVIQKFSDAPLSVHDGCGGKVERLISPPTFQFKGSGWYITDYARKSGGGNGAPSPAPAETAPQTESKAAPKPESKPAATTESKK